MKEVFAQRLEELRKEAGLTLQQVGDRVGARRQVVGSWAKGKYLPRSVEDLAKLADVLKTSVDYLLGRSSERFPKPHAPRNIREAVLASKHAISRVLDFIDVSDKGLPPRSGRQIPIVGTIPAGPPETWNDLAEGFVMIPDAWVRTRDEILAIRVNGNSMSPTLEAGNVVVLRKTMVREGDIVAARVGGELTLKRLEKSGKRPILKPDSPRHKSIQIDEDTILEWKVVAVLYRHPRGDV